MTNIGIELQLNGNHSIYGNYKTSRDIIYDNNYDYKNQENEELQQLLITLNDIEQMQRNMLLALVEQDISLDNIECNMDNINTLLDMSSNDLEQAYKMQFRYIPVIIGCSIGIFAFGPLALIPSFKIGGLLTGLGAGSVGGYFGYKYQ